jgi:dihydrolipoamide dehydrogenase
MYHQGAVRTRACGQGGQHAKEWGISIGARRCAIDMSQVQDRKNRIVSSITRGVEYLFKKNKIDWIKGTARLTGDGGVDVFEGNTQTLRARREIIVATGSAPRSVPGIEIDHTRIITSDEAVHLKDVPKSLVIMGGGAVGVEFASIFRRFGSNVTMLELLPRLVPVEDEAVSAELEKSFRKQGIIRKRKVTRQSDGDGVDVDVQLASGTAERFRADYLLVATGRGPVTSGLNVEGVGLVLEKGFIRVDEEYRTSVPGISAVGDVITLGTPGHPQLAHVSSAEGLIAAERIAGRRATQLRPGSGCTSAIPIAAA